jgi:hypothetical protein
MAPRISPDDVWQSQATAAAVAAVREMVTGGAIPPMTPISKLSDIELGWMNAASLFSWIKTRSLQATNEGWNMEATLQVTALDPQPWDAGAVESILPQLGNLQGVDWALPITSWPKDTMVKFLIEAFRLIDQAMLARDVGGGIATRSKGLEEMQRIASAEAGGPLMAPNEMNDSIPF